MAEMVVHSAPGVATRSPFQETGQDFQGIGRLPAASRCDRLAAQDNTLGADHGSGNVLILAILRW